MNYFDIPRLLQFTFQDPATPIMEGIIDLHHNIFFFLILILSLVLYLFFSLLHKFYYLWMFPTTKSLNLFQKNYLVLNSIVHGTLLEVVWTLVPSFILLLIAVPSFALLYSMDEVIDPKITIKVIGHQWYWQYECNDPSVKFNFDSYMVPEAELSKGDFRLLEVDNKLVLPVNTHVRFLITGADVLHSFAVPSFGIKVDAVPGRLNQTSVYVKREGTFYGQCSELCGVNHGFMPIKVNVVSLNEFLEAAKNY
jgi:cytochrome c oxidase subunit 2